MNLDKIVKECPRAWEECLLFLRRIEYDIKENETFRFTSECGTINISGFGFVRESFHYRKLYDYFDSVGIHIVIWLVEEGGFGSMVYESDENNFNYDALTRTEAEYSAFEQAFEIYENKLMEK